MKIRRFVARDMRTALAQIKDELGVDAVIMSNKKIPEGVELMAAVDYNQSVSAASEPNESVGSSTIASNNQPKREVSDEVVKLSQQASHAVNATQPNQEKTPTPADSLSALLNRQVQKPAQQREEPVVGNIDEPSIEQQLKNFTDRLSQSTDTHNESPSHNHIEQDTNVEDSITANFAPEQSHSADSQQVNNEQVKYTSDDMYKMQQEMASIRAILEHQVSGLMWQDMAQKDPQRAVLVNRLLSLGINEQIADQIAGYVPESTHEKEAWSQAKKLISSQLNTTQNEIIHRGGVVALVGPTGVGKTTTIAKLAAGFAQVHGSEQVALISTDTYRIAGFEQLSTYGKIIGCQVSLAKDSQELDVLLQQFSNKKLVLIDTAGMGQRDIRLAEQLTALVSNPRVRIRNYLVLAANSQQAVMQENVDRFKKVPLSGCIYTKLDESISMGEIISTSIQNGLPIGYLTDGQRVPEDIKVANAEKLVNLADKMATKLTHSSASNMRPMPVARTATV